MKLGVGYTILEIVGCKVRRPVQKPAANETPVAAQLPLRISADFRQTTISLPAWSSNYLKPAGVDGTSLPFADG